jgi:His-Xaa-Ser system radical SAM maturase HxsC
VIRLQGRPQHLHVRGELDRRVWLLEEAHTLSGQRRGRAYLLGPGEHPPPGYDLYIIRPNESIESSDELDWIELPLPLAYLSAGDIIGASPDGKRLRVLWRHTSFQNSVLLTERCDNYCLMCSQPPKEANDDWLLDDATELIRLLPPQTEQIGFTGGEPTLYGQGLVDLLRLCTTLLPRAGVHVLSNGRRFADLGFAASWATIDNPDLMVGIPIYGAEPSLHDYVVQARGAFDDTVRGILNLARLDQRIEIRIVIHKQTAPALVEIAQFIARNLPFVDQVALMGLETTGFARANLETVWIDPIEYAPDLTEAALLLDRARIRTMIYNHQLCLIEPRAWPFTVKSISDWKNEYHPECGECSVLSECGGFFHSAKYRMSDHIKAITPHDERGDMQWLSVTA